MLFKALGITPTKWGKCILVSDGQSVTHNASDTQESNLIQFFALGVRKHQRTF